MKNLLHNRFLSVFIVLITFCPTKALAELFRSTDWITLSKYESPRLSIASIGPGGLIIDMTKQVDLDSSDLSYSNGNLYVNNLSQNQIKIPVHPLELRDALELTRNSDDLILETSIDQTYIYNYTNSYRSEPLKNTEVLKDLFLEADLEFAEMVQEVLAMPENSVPHPYATALQLLETNKEYENLTTDWILPPLSWPQINLIFNSNVNNLVNLEFRPQVLFRTPNGYPVKVEDNVQKIGELPYQFLIKDVQNNSNSYLSVLPFVDRATTMTAVLGILNSACEQPKSCDHLLTKFKDQNLTEQKKDYQTEVLDKLKYQHDFSHIEPKYGKSFINRWQEIIKSEFNKFQPNNSPKAWANAYDAVQIAIANRGLAPEALVLAKKQFLSQPIPENDALLEVSAAWVFIQQQGEENQEKALQFLAEAIENSENYPGERLIVAQTGLEISELLESKDQETAESLRKTMGFFAFVAYKEAYDEIDQYLGRCVQIPSLCSSEDLRRWEAETAKINFPDKLSDTIDLSYLYGRFAYLIGVKEPNFSSDRLRLLSQYTKFALEEHQQELSRLEQDLRMRVKKN